MVFETAEELVFAPGETVKEVGGVQGESGEEIFGTSDGITKFQAFTIEAAPIIDGTLKVYVVEGASV